VLGRCTNPKEEAEFDGAGALTVPIGLFDVSAEEINTWRKGEQFYEHQRIMIKL